MLVRSEDGQPASQWIRGQGNPAEINSALRNFLPGHTPTSPGEICAIAETMLHGRSGSDRHDGRVVMWAAASMGSKRACRRLAEELRSAAAELKLTGLEEGRDIERIAAEWLVAGRGLDLRPARTLMPSEILEFGELLAEPPPPAVNGRVVIRSVGDAHSTDGRQLTARFDGVVGVPLPLAGQIPPAGRALREISAVWPWAENVGVRMETETALLRSVGSTQVRLKPFLLIGQPGGGKTKLARAIASIFGLPATVIPAAGSSDAATLAAVTRDWRNSRPCGPVIAAMEAKCCNPCIIIDEIDKATAPGAKNGSVHGALLGMIGDAEHYYDACLMSEVDLSQVTFIATANDLDLIPEPVLDRFEVVHVGRPRKQDFDIIISNLRAAEAAALGVHPAMLPWLDHLEIDVMRNAFVSGGSLRSLEKAHRFMLGEAAIREGERASMPN